MDDKNINYPTLKSLYEDFKHPNPYINNKAIIQMLNYFPEESMQYFIKNLDKDDIDLRRKSVKALGYFGSSIFLPLVNLFYLNKNITIRVSCLKVFVKVVPSVSLEELPKNFFDVINIAIKDDEPQMILTVVTLLRQLKLIGLPILKNLCKDSNSLRACAAITAISELKDSSIEPFLCELLNEKKLDKLVKDSIKQALNLK
tara:strand:- start:82 stop:684 length:603 start_codon:yes stop_codon:yes gene_type:complete